jgi:hypothetical protein
MYPAALAITLLASAADTDGAIRDSLSRDSLAANYSPTRRNAWALDGIAAFHPCLEWSGGYRDWGPSVGSGRGAAEDTVLKRSRAVEHSDLYYTRLKIHRIGSYLTVPLFLAQYLAGQELWKHPDSHGLARDVHGPLAAGIAGLFTVNTVTGVWNLWEARRDPGGTRRWIHGLTMLVADAGFVVVGATVPDREFDEGSGPPVPPPSSGGSLHRNVAIGSMGLALGSYLMMLIWKD